MKISMLSTFYPFRGGIAQFGTQLHRSLESQGHKVKSYTFTTQYPGFLFPGKSQFVEDGDTAESIPTERVLSSVNPISFRRTANKIKNDKPDLFISQYWMTFFGPALGFVHKKLKGQTKSISILHNVIPHERRFFDSAANRYFLKNIDGFVVMSDTVEKDLLSLKSDAKVLKIDHPIYDQFGTISSRIDSRKKLNLDQQKKYLLFFGFIRDYKGLDVLIKALNMLDDSIELIIAGEVYGTFEKYDTLIHALQLNGRVHLFTRYISDEEVKEFFCASDVCVLPYKSATQSGITAISNHFEIPVVATNVGGLKSTIGDRGMIAPNANPESLANTINEYFRDAKSEEFKSNIRKWKEINSWDNFSKRIIEFAKSL